MTRDVTLEQMIETTLYTAGVHNSGELASMVMETVRDELLPVITDLESRMNQLGGFDGRFSLRKAVNRAKELLDE